MIWWHRRILKHRMRVSKVTVPMFDPWSKGLLIRCECEKVWAK